MKQLLTALLTAAICIGGSIAYLNTSQAEGMQRVAEAFFELRAQVYRTQALSDPTNDQFDPLDRTTRNDVVVGTTLKVGDDVMYMGYQPIRIVAPGRGRDYFSGYQVDDTGSETGVLIHAACITDRAPLDPEEDPLPIFLDPEDPRIGQCP